MEKWNKKRNSNNDIYFSLCRKSLLNIGIRLESVKVILNTEIQNIVSFIISDFVTFVVYNRLSDFID